MVTAAKGSAADHETVKACKAAVEAAAAGEAISGQTAEILRRIHESLDGLMKK